MKHEYNDVGRASGSAGMTDGAGVESGLSTHRQITDTAAKMGQESCQGQRPKAVKSTSSKHRGKTYGYK